MDNRRRRPIPLCLEPLEDRTVPATLLDTGTVVAVAANRPGIQEDPVPVFLNNVFQENAQVVEIFQNISGTSQFPLTGAALANTFIRLAYLNASSGSALGSSLIASASFRPQGEALELIPVVSRIDVSLGPNNTVALQQTAAFGTLATEIVTLEFPLGSFERTEVRGTISFVVNEDITLQADLLGKDAFRLLTVSTMFATLAEGWDTSALQFVDRHGVRQQLELSDATPRDSHLFLQALPLALTNAAFSTVKEPGSAWFPDSPTLEVTLHSATRTNPGGAAENLAVGIEGFLAASLDRNDDSLSVWFEAMLDAPTLPAQTRIDTVFTAAARPPRTIPTTLSAPVFLAPAGDTTDPTPTLAWSPVVGATQSELRVTNLTTGQRILREVVAGSEFTGAMPLRRGKYRTKVRVLDAAGQPSAWSSPLNFRIVIAIPQVLTPAGTITDATPTFTFTAAPDAVTYDLKVMRGSVTVIRQTVEDTQFTPSTDLPLGRYTARVRVRNAAGQTGNWSDPVAFTIEASLAGLSLEDRAMLWQLR